MNFLLISLLALSQPSEENIHWSVQLRKHTRVLLTESPKAGSALKALLAAKPNELINQNAPILASVEIQLTDEETAWLAKRNALDTLREQFIDLYLKTFFHFSFIPIQVQRFDEKTRLISLNADSDLATLARLSLHPQVKSIEFFPGHGEVPTMAHPRVINITNDYYPNRIHAYVRSFLGANQESEFSFSANEKSSGEAVTIQIGNSAPTLGFKISVLDKNGEVLYFAEIPNSWQHSYFKYGSSKKDRAASFEENISVRRDAPDLNYRANQFQIRRDVFNQEVAFELRLQVRGEKHTFTFGPDDLAQQYPTKIIRMTN